MSILLKEVWLPKTRGGRLLMAIVVTFATVYVAIVLGNLIENQYDVTGEYVCSIGFDFPREFPCSLLMTGLVGIGVWIELSSFLGLLPVIIPCLIVWFIIEAFAKNHKSNKVNFAPTQGVQSVVAKQSPFSVFGKVLYYLFIGFTIYVAVMFALNILIGLLL